MRSQSLPPELSSLSMRSAKFGHGTNSYFMVTPVFASKSFDSSTRALAGSHAAQHSVSSRASAPPAWLSATRPAPASMPAIVLMLVILFPPWGPAGLSRCLVLCLVNAHFTKHDKTLVVQCTIDADA